MSSELRGPVMADVAARAGVSIMTVSRVLSGYPGVRPATRESVEQAIASLGYRVNTVARALAGGRSHTLGVVSIETAYFGPAQMLLGIEAAARTMEHRVSFMTLRHTDERELRESLDHLRSAHIDGAIVIAPVRAAVDALADVEPGVPLVVLCGDETPGRPTVAVDQREGARLATQHLLELGHATVHHIRGQRDWIDADAREAGWRHALRSAGIRAPRPRAGDWTPASGYRIGQRLAADDDVTAIFVANDQMALGVLLALAEAGRRIPRDVSVVGFDDTPESAFFRPPLTTVRQDLAEVGRRGVELLIAQIEGEPVDAHEVVSPQLVVRNTSARPPAPRTRRPRERS